MQIWASYCGHLLTRSKCRPAVDGDVASLASKVERPRLLLASIYTLALVCILCRVKNEQEEAERKEEMNQSTGGSKREREREREKTYKFL